MGKNFRLNQPSIRTSERISVSTSRHQSKTGWIILAVHELTARWNEACVPLANAGYFSRAKRRESKRMVSRDGLTPGRNHRTQSRMKCINPLRLTMIWHKVHLLHSVRRLHEMLRPGFLLAVLWQHLAKQRGYEGISLEYDGHVLAILSPCLPLLCLQGIPVDYRRT